MVRACEFIAADRFLCLQAVCSVIFAKLAIIILNGERQRPFLAAMAFR